MSSYRTLNDLLKAFRDIGGRHQQINTFFVGQDFDLGNETVRHPILSVNPVSAVLPKNENGYSLYSVNFTVKVMDLVNKNKSNEEEVLSDNLEVLKDIVTEFNTHPFYIESDFNIEGDISFSTVRGVFDSDLTGWETEITIVAPNKSYFCGLPLNALNGVEYYPDLVANVKNSDDTYNTTVIVAQTLELPDITHTNSDGSPVTLPAQTPFVCTPAMDLDLPTIFSKYGFLNMWTSENITINGTTTTMHDYAGLYDLSNPTAASQPTYNASDSNFGGKPSFKFTPFVDILKANVANWRGLDTSGVFVEVVKLDTGTRLASFTTADEGSALSYMQNVTRSNIYSIIYFSIGIFSHSPVGKSDIVVGFQPNVLAHGSTGSEYKIWVGGRSEAITMAGAGANNGTWLNQIVNRDNVAIGMENSSGILSGDFTTVFAGYLPYTDNDTINAALNDLNKYYKI